MEYVLETKFKDIKKTAPGVGGSKQEYTNQPKATIGFNTEYLPNHAYPALIFIPTRGVNYKKNRVSFNGNFLGYLRAGSDITILQVDNSISGNLKQRGNRLSVLACDLWGNSAPVSKLVLDDFKVTAVQVAYSRKGK